NAAGDSASDHNDTGDAADLDPGTGNARAATVAGRSRGAASRARDRSGGPDSASHGGSAKTAARATHRARRSRPDDGAVAAAARTASDTDAADDADYDHHRGTASGDVATAAAVA